MSSLVFGWLYIRGGDVRGCLENCFGRCVGWGLSASSLASACMLATILRTSSSSSTPRLRISSNTRAHTFSSASSA